MVGRSRPGMLKGFHSQGMPQDNHGPRSKETPNLTGTGIVIRLGSIASANIRTFQPRLRFRSRSLNNRCSLRHSRCTSTRSAMALHSLRASEYKIRASSISPTGSRLFLLLTRRRASRIRISWASVEIRAVICTVFMFHKYFRTFKVQIMEIKRFRRFPTLPVPDG
jgi:hypothetical protein